MAVDINQLEAAIRGIRAARTATSYVRIAAAFLATVVDDGTPTVRDVAAFLERKASNGNRRAPSTRNQELAALRALAKYALREDLWKADPTTGIEFAKVPRRAAVFFTSQELQRLFRAANSNTSEVARTRDVAILGLLSQVGLRVHEVVGLDTKQIDLSQEILVGVRGKGDTIADLPISLEVVIMLSRWLDKRPTIAHATEQALFVSRLGRRISVRSVERIIVRLREKAGITKSGSCHSLRHTWATLSLEFGTDIGTVSEVLRHSSIAVTQRYIHCFDGRRREAVRRMAKTIPREVVVGVGPATDNTQTIPSGYPQKSIDVQENWDDVA